MSPGYGVTWDTLHLDQVVTVLPPISMIVSSHAVFISAVVR